MKKKCNVIQISGLKGILLAVFLVGCAITGFIVFPSWCCMHIWNYIAQFINFPIMNMCHGTILWAIIVLAFIATHLNHLPVKVGSFTKIEREDLRRTLENLKMQNMSELKNDDSKKETTDSTTKEN